MKLEKIIIENFKSIKYEEFIIEKIGGSTMRVFIGKNGTGKSNVLDAMNFINYDPTKEYSHVKYRNKQLPSGDAVKVSFLYKNLEKKILLEDLKKDGYELKEEFFAINTIEKVLSIKKGEKIITKKISFISSIKDGLKFFDKHIITMKEFEPLTEEQKNKYKDLTSEELTRILLPYIEKQINLIKCIYWLPNESHLITEDLNLSIYKDNITSSKYDSFKQLFLLKEDINNDLDIKNAIDELLENKEDSSHRRMLQKKLSELATKYIKNVWRENKIKIEVEIDNTLIMSVKISDEDKEDVLHSMADRSQGFKQYFSLLFSLSLNTDIKNSIILIDEPEVHLHPSGIRYMKDQLLELGEDNYLFVATHSDFLLDANNHRRHFLFAKKKGVSILEQVGDGNLYDEEILNRGFGINFLKDFISPKKILVEGFSDKIILRKVFNLLNKDEDIRITNSRGANIVSTASLFKYYDILPLIIVDDDEGGKKYKKDILGMEEYKEKVFTIRDINGNIKEGGTIEDCLPQDYVENKIRNIQDGEINFSLFKIDDSPYIEQLKLFINKEYKDKDKKEKINFIIENFKKDISDDFNPTKKFFESNLLLKELCENIITKI